MYGRTSSSYQYHEHIHHCHMYFCILYSILYSILYIPLFGQILLRIGIFPHPNIKADVGKKVFIGRSLTLLDKLFRPLPNVF